MFAVGDEIDGGRAERVGADGAGIDGFALPEVAEAGGGGVVAECGDIGDAGALAGGGHGGVAGVAAAAFEIETRQVGGGARLFVEFQHRFADADEFDGHCNTARAASSIAARSPAAMRFSSIRAPPMPTKAAPAAR